MSGLLQEGDHRTRLRDEFAGRVMAALVGSDGFWKSAAQVREANGNDVARAIARQAYEQADAMLAERAKGIAP